MALTRSNERVSRPRSVSGSICSPMAVDPTRSQNRTVTVLRDSAAGPAAASSAAPHEKQNRASAGFSVPQLAHTRAESEPSYAPLVDEPLRLVDEEGGALPLEQAQAPAEAAASASSAFPALAQHVRQVDERIGVLSRDSRWRS